MSAAAGIGSCSTVGPGGSSAASTRSSAQARAERASRDSVNWNRLIEEARQERLGKIDEQAEAADEARRPQPLADPAAAAQPLTGSIRR